MSIIVSLDDLSELKGQIVDAYEDFASEYNLDLPNSDRDDAIEDGEDPEDLAIIYGDAYDFIADTVDVIFVPNPENNFERILPICTDGKIGTYVIGELATTVSGLTYDAFEALFKPHNSEFDFSEHTAALTDAAKDTIEKFIEKAIEFNKLPEEQRDKKAGIVGRIYTSSPEIIKDFEGDTIAVANLNE
jgi:hypothetical protein